MAYPYLLIEVPQLFIDELSAVVGDDGMGQAKTADDVLPNERMDLPSGDVGQGLCFDPLGEVIHGDYYELFLRSADGEWPDDVHTPLCERLGGR